jgi:flagellar biosynthesis GTPase FlhF
VFASIQLQLIASIIALVLTFSAGWTVNGWRWEKKEQAQKIAQEKVIHDQEIANQAAADQIRKEKDAQINAINNQLFTALSQLRSRPSRSQLQTNNRQSGTGMSLSAEDAEFLVREAARADGLRSALAACYQQYDEVK